MADSLEESMDKEGENPYLALRRANIARNEAKLRDLGLLKPAPRVVSPTNTSKSRKRSATERNSNAAVPVRRSRRLNSNAKDLLTMSPDGRSGVEQEEQEIPVAKPRKKATPKKHTTSTTVNLNPLSARNITLDIDVLIADSLGKPMNATGKAVVMETCAQKFSSMGDSLNGRISFNKYSGVQEWKRCIFLWVNLGAKGNSVVNDFLDGGRKMTWYGGSRMHPESPIIQKLVQVGRIAAKRREEDPNSNAIILWCRQYQPDKKNFGPYYCLGRLEYASHQPETMPVSFVWTLLDFERLVALQSNTLSSMLGYNG